MKRISRNISVVCFLALFSGSLHGQILSIESRQEKLDTMKALLGKTVVPVEADALGYAVNPFNSEQTGLVEEEVEAEVAVDLSDKDLLQALSQYINPTGIFLFGGEFYLIFKERKMNVGTRFNVLYKGNQYAVTVTEINSSSYSVRYGEAELQLKLK
ncbi:hypothetical protein [Pelagicoccus sp. SDUM812003]|uniref:hypothetical protein n=1 Tax=Pelagicoccus sp. SDUM812003 TaxID=3041267 RepID=UPI00280D33EE|nr:hypothetical protein [Pelagicoccus sp. SDUM812003]MDQ8201661.1 hypothetical protein [Pelagicoccus sp. SDUM812003]